MTDASTMKGYRLMPRFAPLNIPLSRRLETLTIAFVASLFFVFMGILVFCVITPLTWPFLACYIAWIYLDSRPERGGARFNMVRNSSLWIYMRNYFPCKLHKEVDLDPSKNYILGYHPHGIISTGIWINFCTEANVVSQMFPGIKIHILTLAQNFALPFWRELLLASGLCSVSKQSLQYILKKPGHSCILVPGGAREALDAIPGTLDLTLNKRKGFVKIALANGCHLVPVMSFGENDIFKQVKPNEESFVSKWQYWFLKNVGVAPCIPYGRGMFQYDYGLLPRRYPINTVVGTPIEVPLIKEPTDEEITKYHTLYVNALTSLYDKYKDKYAKDRIRDLRIIR